MNEWNIQSRAHVCEACAQPFVDKQPFHTLLLDEAAGLRRSDVCDPCWQKQFAGDATSRPGFISHWHGIYEVPPAQPVEAIQKETAETVLRKVIAQNDPRYAPAAYILAVMLERKRILKIKEQFKHDGQRVFVYEQPKTGDLFTIVDPGLHLGQLEQVQQDVAHLLEHGVNPPAAAPAPETPAPLAEPSPAAETPPAPPAESAAAN